MIESPIANYNGLTIILSKPSRHDKQQLIDGYAGQYFERCLLPVSRINCEIRTANEGLANVRPNTKVVILLGAESLKLVKSNVSLNEQRGSPITFNNITFIATYEPQEAYDRKNFFGEDENEHANFLEEKSHQATQRKNWRWWLKEDIKKALRILGGGLKIYNKPNYSLHPSLTHVNKILSESRDKILYLDIETTFDRVITCIGFGILDSPDATPDTIYVIPFKRFFNRLAYEEYDLLNFIRNFTLAMQRNYVVSHNGARFDYIVLGYFYRMGIPLRPIDTMLCHHRNYPEVEKSLGHCISLYTDLPYHKNDGIFEPKNYDQEQQLWRYNADDVWSMMLVYKGIRETGAKLGTLESQDQANSLIRPMLALTFKGIKVDEEKFLNKYDSYNRRLIQLERVLSVIVGFDLNPRSPKQVGDYLYNQLRFPEPDVDKTNETTLLKLLNKKDTPSIRVLIDARGLGKKASALKYKLWETPDGLRSTTIYNIAGTETFRLNSKSLFRFKADKGLGTNLQNQHDDNRSVFVADKGKLLFQIDQAGAEAKVVAHLCRNGKLRSLFKNGVKPHIYVAMYVFAPHFAKEMGLPNLKEFLPPVTIAKLIQHPRWPELRNKIARSGLYYATGKMLVHALNYGMGAPTFQTHALKKSDNQLILTIQECKNYRGMYLDLFNEIPEWWEETRYKIKTTRKLNNLFGHPRVFTQPFGDELWKQSYAFIPQSTIGQITNEAIKEIQARIESGEELLSGVDLLQNGHDGILGQVPEEKINEVTASLRTHLEKEFPVFELKIGTEVEVGKNWKKKTKNNPDGLEEI